MSQDLCLHEILAISKSSDHYSSTTSSTSIGQAFAQIPQAIHLEAGFPSVFTIRYKWTGLRTGSASRTFFLVDHVNALRVLGDGAFRTRPRHIYRTADRRSGGQPFSLRSADMPCPDQIPYKMPQNMLPHRQDKPYRCCLFLLSVFSFCFILRLKMLFFLFYHF